MFRAPQEYLQGITTIFLNNRRQESSGFILTLHPPEEPLQPYQHRAFPLV